MSQATYCVDSALHAIEPFAVFRRKGAGISPTNKIAGGVSRELSREPHVSLQYRSAREDEVAREWEWLNEAINLVARARSEDETDNAFRLLQQQAMAVGQRRVELRLRMAELEAMAAQDATEP